MVFGLLTARGKMLWKRTIKNVWKFGYTVTLFLSILILKNFADDMTLLPCHGQKFVTTISLKYGWEQSEISIKFEIR